MTTPPRRGAPTSGPTVLVVGGGLAGSEAAWQIASRGVDVVLCEMRPDRQTPAHRSSDLAELVCSNSLGSDLVDRAAGLLKAECRRLGSLLVAAADATAVPAGSALAVDRAAFARHVTEAIASHPRIRLRREEVTRVPDAPAVIASGPLTSDALAADLARHAGRANLHFFDALAPIVRAASIDMTIAFRQSRYGRGARADGDYINCPMDRAQFEVFATALGSAERIELRDFERNDARFFEACLPIEVIAERGERALLFGPLRPVGLRDPRSGARPYAVVQLRQDDAADTLYNLVGFQTNLRWPEQERILRTVPGLARAEFVRFGQMHRNTFVAAPALLGTTLALRDRPGLFVAGQVGGAEGYAASIGTGLVAGVAAARHVLGQEPLALPPQTMLGALCRYLVTSDVSTFQPMKPNFGLLPTLAPMRRGKVQRHADLADHAIGALERFLSCTDWAVAGAATGAPWRADPGEATRALAEARA